MRPTFIKCSMLALAIVLHTSVIATRTYSQTAAPVSNVAAKLVQRHEALSLEQSLAAFETSPDVEIECVASEPEIVDPVAARFDRAGRLWVVEMRDYPTGPPEGEKPRGTIRILRDKDGDGRFESSTVFVTGLDFATGIQPWRDGVIVTLAGRVAYFADQDGDDRCDMEQTWFKGFAEDNTQLRANHPVLGADGLVYIASGLRGGTIESTDSRWAAHANPVRLLHSDFAFDPNGGFWDAVSGDSQYGMHVDDFGNRLGVSNRNPAKLAVLPLTLVSHDPWLLPASTVWDVAASGAESEVRPITEAWTTSNLHAGQFSAACAVHRVAASRLPDGWQGSILTCEPTGYLVQRATIDRHDAVPHASAVFNPGEAIASRDAWFRPVDLFEGPDGSLYLVDMHRAVIEHPQWVPDELKKRTDERYGEANGRIYRVRKRELDASDVATASRPVGEDAYRFSSPSNALEWTTMLDHPNGWQREEATRWLVEHGPQRASDLQAVLPKLTSAAGLARACFLLAHWNYLSLDDCQRLASHADPQLRAVIARLAPTLEGGDAISRRMLADSSPRVRLAASIAIASAIRPIDAETCDDIARLVLEPKSHDAIIFALGAVADENVFPVLQAIVSLSRTDQSSSKLDASSFTEVTRRLVRRHAALQPSEPPMWLELSPTHRLTLASAWLEGIRRSGASPDKLIADWPDALHQSWDAMLDQAVECAANESETEDRRVEAVRLVALRSDASTRLRPVRSLGGSPRVRLAVIETCCAADRDEHVVWLEGTISELPWELAAHSVKLALARPSGQAWVLDAIQSGRLARGLLTPQDADRLLQSKEPEIAEKAQLVLQAAGADRLQIIHRYKSELAGTSDPQIGQRLFLQHCAACHQINGQGFHVGPDISDSRTQTPDGLLVSILDPSRAIDAGFVRYTALTVDGRVFDGLLVDDRPTSITLKLSGGNQVTLPRDEIETLVTRGVSLMPDGFEQLIPPADMNHLIGYLKNWRYQ